MKKDRSPIDPTPAVQTVVLDSNCSGYVVGTGGGGGSANVVTVADSDWGKTIESTGATGGTQALTVKLPTAPPPAGTWLRVLNAVNYTLIVTTVSVASGLLIADNSILGKTCTWSTSGHMIGACTLVVSTGTKYFVANQSSAAIVMVVGT